MDQYFWIVESPMVLIHVSLLYISGLNSRWSEAFDGEIAIEWTFSHAMLFTENTMEKFKRLSNSHLMCMPKMGFTTLLL